MDEAHFNRQTTILRLDIVHHRECFGVNFCNCAEMYEEELRRAINLDYYVATQFIGKSKFLASAR